VTNIPATMLAGRLLFRITVGQLSVTDLSATYSSVGVGEPVALVGNHGNLEIAVRQGSAAGLAGVAIGGQVLVE